MTEELTALAMGGASGFIFKLISSLVDSQTQTTKMLLKKQQMADDSADRAAARDGGVWTRRAIVGVCLFAVVIAPFILAHSPEGITIGTEKTLFGIINWVNWKTLSGFVILPEIRQTLLAIVGFYFGSSQVK
tara:strand:- start:3288 stop:3683 length:396 start_codon:yes stop_codon:yes gene_type:complete